MQTISFSIRQNDEPFSFDFEKMDLSILNGVTRIMAIEDYQKPLTIEVDYELYMEVKELLYSQHWMINMGYFSNDPSELPIKLIGFELIFKLKNKNENN